MNTDLIKGNRFVACRSMENGELFFLHVDYEGTYVIAGWEVDREGQILRTRRYHIVEKRLVTITEYRQSRKYATLERMPDNLL